MIDVLIANVKDIDYRCGEFEADHLHFIYSPIDSSQFTFLNEEEMIATVDNKDGYTLKTFKDSGEECVFTMPNGHTFFVSIHDNRLMKYPISKG